MSAQTVWASGVCIQGAGVSRWEITNETLGSQASGQTTPPGLSGDIQQHMGRGMRDLIRYQGLSWGSPSPWALAAPGFADRP